MCLAFPYARFPHDREDEREVAHLVALGRTTDEVAAQLGVHPGSVRRHLDLHLSQVRSESAGRHWSAGRAHGVVTVPELQEVYCKRGKWVKGQSGNPKGRPLTRAGPSLIWRG